MSSIVERFLSGEYEITRSKGITYIEGFPTDQGQETIRVKGSLQPLNARELKLAEEGTRLKQGWKFYTDKALLVIGTGKQLARADIIKIRDVARDVTETYKVVSQETWKGFGLEYFKSVVTREPEQ